MVVCPRLPSPGVNTPQANEVLKSETIRDVARALPWLASDPRPEPLPADLGVEDLTEHFNAHAEGLRHEYTVLHALLDRAGKKLAAALDEADPHEILDPAGEGSEALEKAEEYFNTQRDQLERMRGAFVEAGAPSDHDVFKALDSLAGLYEGIVATMQKVRWDLLITDGVKEPETARSFTSGAELVAALDE